MSISQETFKAMLKEKNLKITNQRLLVLEALAENKDKHLTAEDIYEIVRKEHQDIGLATIYRTVQLLQDMNLVDSISLDDGFVRYEISEMNKGKAGHHHHHHLICEKCGNVIPFNDDRLDSLEGLIERETGFHVLNHELKLYGICKECRNENKLK
ncbi:MAG: Fur family transcriptional regulator [Suipraeoptans sp.]